MRASRAFSLIELLVVIAVIAILAALVLSVFGRTRGASQAATCRNNLRQWGMATHLFAADNEDFSAKEMVHPAVIQSRTVGMLICHGEMNLPRLLRNAVANKC